MSTFKGFTFKAPTKQEKEVNDENNKRVNDLTFQFSRISAQENEQGETSRLAAFQTHRSPLTGRSGSERQEKRRLEALELQKKVLRETFLRYRKRTKSFSNSNVVSQSLKHDNWLLAYQ